jgi:RNA polymerase sigma factor (sigma-70 family)
MSCYYGLLMKHVENEARIERVIADLLPLTEDWVSSLVKDPLLEKAPVIDRDDIAQEAAYAVIQYAKNADPDVESIKKRAMVSARKRVDASLKVGGLELENGPYTVSTSLREHALRTPTTSLDDHAYQQEQQAEVLRQSGDSHDTDAAAYRADIQRMVHTGLCSLNDRDRHILSGMYGIGTEQLSRAELAEIYEVTPEHAGQLADKARKKLAMYLVGQTSILDYAEELGVTPHMEDRRKASTAADLLA